MTININESFRVDRPIFDCDFSRCPPATLPIVVDVNSQVFVQIPIEDFSKSVTNSKLKKCQVTDLGFGALTPKTRLSDVGVKHVVGVTLYIEVILGNMIKTHTAPKDNGAFHRPQFTRAQGVSGTESTLKQI